MPPPASSAAAEPVVNRFGPTHSAAERKVSTAERFGVGRSGQTALASQPAPQRRPTPRPVAVVPDPLPDADADAGAADAEPEANNHAEPVLERRLSTARPLRARRIAPGPDEDADAEFAPPLRRGHIPDADEVYQAFADLGADDPVTAPVAAVDVDDQGGYFDGIDGIDDAEALDYPSDSEDTGEALAGGGDQVRIRAGQAGAAGRGGSGGAARARPAGDDRQARPGRLKLRRRPQGSP